MRTRSWTTTKNLNLITTNRKHPLKNYGKPPTTLTPFPTRSLKPCNAEYEDPNTCRSQNAPKKTVNWYIANAYTFPTTIPSSYGLQEKLTRTQRQDTREDLRPWNLLLAPTSGPQGDGTSNDSSSTATRGKDLGPPDTPSSESYVPCLFLTAPGRNFQWTLLPDSPGWMATTKYW
jgi:hypothetical protein